MSGSDRDKYGCIVNLVSLENGAQVVLHLLGRVLPALAELCEELDERPGEWRIRTISTPQSIYSDLKGRGQGQRLASYEAQLLSQLGRRDLLERPPAHKRTRARAAGR